MTSIDKLKTETLWLISRSAASDTDRFSGRVSIRDRWDCYNEARGLYDCSARSLTTGTPTSENEREFMGVMSFKVVDAGAAVTTTTVNIPLFI